MIMASFVYEALREIAKIDFVFRASRLEHGFFTSHGCNERLRIKMPSYSNSNIRFIQE